jgi:hypothetical protein
MPQPNKKRGRRGEGKKRKLEDGVEDDPELVESSVKRRKSTADGSVAEGLPSLDDGNQKQAYPSEDRAFFGVLDEEEQEYFKHADNMLESNEFGDPEERILFLANVYREAEGKELKIAQSQSCSRLMERLIQLSSTSQLKTLFEKFGGKYVEHRYHSVRLKSR